LIASAISDVSIAVEFKRWCWSQERHNQVCGGSMVGSVPCVRKVPGFNPALAATYGPRGSSSPTMLCITIVSSPLRHESALLSLACSRKRSTIKDQLYCIVKVF